MGVTNSRCSCRLESCDGFRDRESQAFNHVATEQEACAVEAVVAVDSNHLAFIVIMRFPDLVDQCDEAVNLVFGGGDLGDGCICGNIVLALCVQ